LISPSGKLVQIEYALAAVASGAASVGLKATNGVVLATEKKHKSILNEEHSTFKIEKVVWILPLHFIYVVLTSP
jgi:20S proteasome subunit alpha 2